MNRENIIKEVCEGLLNYFYREEFEITKQLMVLFDTLSKSPLTTSYEYIKMYEDSFYTFKTWEALVKSEEEESEGWTEEECTEQIGKSIWQLPCGWYVQCI